MGRRQAEGIPLLELLGASEISTSVPQAPLVTSGRSGLSATPTPVWPWPVTSTQHLFPCE